MTAEISNVLPPPDMAPSLSIGVPSIDKERHGLFLQFDVLNSDIEADARSATFSEIFSRQGHQISAHFDSEENVFRSFGMPVDEVLSHIQAHTAILDQYTKPNPDLMAGKLPSRPELLTMITQWGIEHVVIHDITISDFLPARRRKISCTRFECQPFGRLYDSESTTNEVMSRPSVPAENS